MRIQVLYSLGADYTSGFLSIELDLRVTSSYVDSSTLLFVSRYINIYEVTSTTILNVLFMYTHIINKRFLFHLHR